MENTLLRQQLMVLKRRGKRPTLTWRDRKVLVLLASKLPHLEGGAGDRAA